MMPGAGVRISFACWICSVVTAAPLTLIAVGCEVLLLCAVVAMIASYAVCRI